jgi:hypothetical protein
MIAKSYEEVVKNIRRRRERFQEAKSVPLYASYLGRAWKI